MSEKITDIFLELFCEKNTGGTKHLRLKGNELQQRISYRLKYHDMHKVAAFLKNHSEIISLDLSYNDIGDRGVKILAEEYFDEENNLQHINLMHCDMEMEGVKSLAEAKFLKMYSLRLNGNKIGHTAAKWIASLIQKSPYLVHLDISETDQDQDSIESILIVCERSALKILDISRIIPPTFSRKLDPEILADELAVVLKLNQSLVELHVQKCNFDGHDVDLMVQGLRESTSLQMLDLGYNGMGDLGAQALADWLKSRPPLRALILAGNCIREIGARALSFGLPFSKVRYLDISDNRINDVGLTRILDTLKKSSQKRYMFFWGNVVGPITCKRIERMLASGALNQLYMDIKVYTVDGQLYAAYYPANHYKHKYYDVMDYGCAVELKIKRNRVPNTCSQPRELLNLTNISRYPPVDELLGLKQRKNVMCPED